MPARIFKLDWIRRPAVLAGLFLLILIPLWFFLAIPQLEKIPEDFVYSTGVFSQDSFYESHHQTFLGPSISKTIFSYDVIESDGDLRLIENTFEVQKITGEKIFGVRRIYGINAITKQHDPNFGDESRTGYLFGPPHANKKDFTYWHINYNTPAVMHFVDEEVIFGMKTYHYKSSFQADQTQELSGVLPDVPALRGVSLDVNFDLWIEPMTGAMVKYQDDAFASYYDQKSRQFIEPWNHFENHTNPASVSDTVEKLRAQIWLWSFFEVGVPILLFLLAVFLFMFSDPSFKRLISELIAPLFHNGLFLLVLLVILLLVFLIMVPSGASTNSTPTYTIGISLLNDGPLYQENLTGFKKGLSDAGFIEGKNIHYLIEKSNEDLEQQQLSIESLVSKKVDLIYVLTTRGTTIAKGITPDTPIVFSIVTYPVKSGLIDSMELSHNNLVGTTNYVSPAAQFYLMERLIPDINVFVFVHRKNESNSAFQLEDFNQLLSKKGIRLVEVAAINLSDLEEHVKEEINDASVVYAACDTLNSSGGHEILVRFSQEYHKPLFACNQDGVESGALGGVVALSELIGKAAGKKAAFILEGAQPSWIPTENPKSPQILLNESALNDFNVIIPADIQVQAVMVR